LAEYKREFGRTPLTVALAFPCQIEAAVPVESHDVKMDLVITL
jgi:5-formyltetrahydrofolate cyclo-ligase